MSLEDANEDADCEEPRPALGRTQLNLKEVLWSGLLALVVLVVATALYYVVGRDLSTSLAIGVGSAFGFLVGDAVRRWRSRSQQQREP